MDRRLAGVLVVALVGAYALQPASFGGAPTDADDLRDLVRQAEREAATDGGERTIGEPVAVDDAGARTLAAPGRVVVPIEYGDGAFYLYDRQRAAEPADRDGSMEALEATFDGRTLSGESRDRLAVMGVRGDAGGVPLDLELLAAPPAPVPAGIDGAVAHDLDLPTGELVSEANGGGTRRVIARLPRGAYRVRAGVTLGAEERYMLQLWPRSGPRRGSRLVRPLG